MAEQIKYASLTFLFAGAAERQNVAQVHKRRLMEKQDASVVDNLRALRQQKTLEKAAAWRRRSEAIEPILHFATTLQAAGEIEDVAIEETSGGRVVCTIITRSDRRIVITCESAEREPGRAHELVQNISIEIVGRLKNPFRTYGNTLEADYEKIFQFVLEWIAELDAETEVLKTAEQESPSSGAVSVRRGGNTAG